MFTVDASKVRGLIFERGLTLSDLAKSANLNLLTARKVVVDGAKVTSKTIAALAKLFGVDGNEIILVRGDS